MPWKGDIYNCSLWAKEELPTWSELYHKFYLPQVYTYDPEIDKEIDPYWKIPKKKLLLGQVCNQLNKYIHEDNIDISPYLEKYRLSNINKIFFYLYNDKISLSDGKGFSQFPIYTWKIPSTGAYSIFITNNYPRIDINSLDGVVSLHTQSITYNGLKSFQMIDYRLIQFLLEDLISYFKDQVDWKDIKK
jgi:hypothetical protein